MEKEGRKNKRIKYMYAQKRKTKSNAQVEELRAIGKA